MIISYNNVSSLHICPISHISWKCPVMSHIFLSCPINPISCTSAWQHSIQCAICYCPSVSTQHASTITSASTSCPSTSTSTSTELIPSTSHYVMRHKVRDVVYCRFNKQWKSKTTYEMHPCSFCNNLIKLRSSMPIFCKRLPECICNKTA